jgi:hypothetical protein
MRGGYCAGFPLFPYPPLFKGFHTPLFVSGCAGGGEKTIPNKIYKKAFLLIKKHVYLIKKRVYFA